MTNLVKILFIVFFAFLGCGLNSKKDHQIEILNKLVNDWAIQNPRILDSFEIKSSKRNLFIVFKDTCKICPEMLEKISSANLVNRIANSKFNISTYDTIAIGISTISHRAKYNGYDAYLTNTNFFLKNHIERLKEVLSNETMKNISDYFTFNMPSAIGVEFEQGFDALKEGLEWFNFKGKSGIGLIYEYSVLKTGPQYSENKETLERLKRHILAMYKLFKGTEVDSFDHLDNILKILNDIPENIDWNNLNE